MFFSEEFILNDGKFKKLMTAMVSLTILLILFSFCFGIPTVKGSSMEPTLHEGDRYFVVKSPLVKEYEKGDIVFLHLPGSKKMIMKRIVAIPGDRVVLNSKKSIILKEDEVFLMGDNRGDSFDSRDFGPVKEKELKGKFIKKIFGRKASD